MVGTFFRKSPPPFPRRNTFTVDIFTRFKPFEPNKYDHSHHKTIAYEKRPYAVPIQLPPQPDQEQHPPQSLQVYQSDQNHN